MRTAPTVTYLDLSFMSLKPWLGSITIQTTKPVCLQMKGLRDFPSSAISWKGKVGCIVPESIYSHNSLCSLPLAALPLQCPWPVPCQLSTFEWKRSQHTFPPRTGSERHDPAMLYVFWATVWDSLLAFVSVTLILSLKPWPTFWEWSLLAAAGFWPLHLTGIQSVPLLGWLWPRAITAFMAPVQRAWASPSLADTCALVAVTTKNPQKRSPQTGNHTLTPSTTTSEAFPLTPISQRVTKNTLGFLGFGCFFRFFLNLWRNDLQVFFNWKESKSN